jgi:cellulose synthase/poly-beta-1,6-N-acetylglucosamine synthase-like glycosyltransferase
MNMWITLAFEGALLICVFYVVLIILFTIGWFRLANYKTPASSGIEKVSLIIAARNEEGNIGNCLAAILNQDYPSGLFEIIIVNDHSTDNTVLEINRVIAANPGIQVRLLQLSGEKQGKKAAITLAVSEAKNEWIVTADADCIMGSNWLKSLMGGASDPAIHMLLAPVIFQKTKTISGHLQELEFLSLIASSAGAVSVRLPIMCNGANLAYRKAAFIKAGGFVSDNGYASGDDIFLMMKIKKMFGSRSINFVKSTSASVFTHAAPSLNEFMNQRLRWVSKSKGYKDPWVQLTSIIVFAQSLFLLVALLAWVTGLIGPMLSIVLFTGKFLADITIMTSVCRFTNQSRLIIWYLPLQLIYPVYIVLIGILGNILSFSWKGRKLR